jgi:hypothetical protein
MSTTAPDTSSVPYERPAVKTQNPIEITITRQRCNYRMRVVYDTRLSPGARLLYVALDDHAGMKAEAWPKQELLATRLGMSLSRIEVWTAELKRSGYVVARKTARGNRYSMGWSAAPQPAERPVADDECDPLPTTGAYKEDEPATEPEVLASSPAPAEIQETRREVAPVAQPLGLPDSGTARNLLEAARRHVPEARPADVASFLADKFSARRDPWKSWGGAVYSTRVDFGDWWEGRKAACPYCRHEKLNIYGNCAGCGRSREVAVWAAKNKEVSDADAVWKV